MSAPFWAVLRAAITVGGISLVVKVASVVKEGVVAYRLGTSVELDAFLVAYAFPLFFLNVVSGSLAAAFVPAYVRTRAAQGEAAAGRLTVWLLWRLVGTLIVSVILFPPVCSAIVRWVVSFEISTLTLATDLIYMLMPVLLLNGLTGFLAGFLNARSKFVVAAVVPLATPSLVALALLLFWDEFGIHTVVLGTLLGGAVELGAVALASAKEGLRVLVWPSPVAVNEKGVLFEFVGAAGGNLLIGATVLVDQAMAGSLAPGSVAALGYASRITNALLTIGTMALATAILPQLSELVAKGQFKELRGLLRRCSALTIGLSIPVTALLVVFSAGTIDVLFRRGSFAVNDVELVADVQVAFALQIPFFAWSIVAVRLLSALQANRYLMIGASISLVLDVVLNAVLSAYMGVTGIALATSIVYVVSCVFLWIVALVKLRIASNAWPVEVAADAIPPAQVS